MQLRKILTDSAVKTAALGTVILRLDSCNSLYSELPKQLQLAHNNTAVVCSLIDCLDLSCTYRDVVTTSLQISTNYAIHVFGTNELYWKLKHMYFIFHKILVNSILTVTKTK